MSPRFHEPAPHATSAAPSPHSPRWADRPRFWNRVAARLGLALPESTPDLRRGERHTLLGLGIAAAVHVGFLVGATMLAGRLNPIGLVLGQLPYLIVGAGLLAGSRIARWVAGAYGVLVLVTVGFFFAFVDRIVDKWLSDEKAMQLGGPWIMFAMIAVMAVFASGILLATLSPWARRWQEARRALWRDRAPRRGRSLADWRRGTEAGDAAR